MSVRTLQQIIESVPTSDGAGVKLRRSLGKSQEQRLDPFLMLDEFSSENADDYVGGFPNHPHRGFETVTTCSTATCYIRTISATVGT